MPTCVCVPRLLVVGEGGMEEEELQPVQAPVECVGGAFALFSPFSLVSAHTPLAIKKNLKQKARLHEFQNS